jgi:hypothetical protein
LYNNKKRKGAKMANWSETFIHINGNEEKIEKAKKTLEKFYEKNNEGDVTGLFIQSDEDIFEVFSEYADELKQIQKKDPVGFNAGFEYMEIFDLEEGENSITITGSGRWCSPYLFFEFLARKYKLNMEYFDAECGCDFSYFLRMENGEVIERDDETFLSLNTIKYLYCNNIWEFIENHDWYFREDIELDDNEKEKLDAILKRYGVTIEEVRLEQIMERPTDFKICKECGRLLFYDRKRCIWCGCEEFDEDFDTVLDSYKKRVNI